MSFDRIPVAIQPGLAVSKRARGEFIAWLIARYPMLPQTVYEWSELPSGWMSLLEEFAHRVDVLTMQPPTAKEFFVTGFYIESGKLHMQAESPNRVLEGLIRRYCAKSAVTCCRCGAPGKAYAIDGMEVRPLCAICAAPLVLAEDLERLARVRATPSGQQPRVDFQRLPGSLRPVFVDWLGNRPLVHSSVGAPIGAFPWDFCEWSADIQMLKKKAIALAKERRASV